MANERDEEDPLPPLREARSFQPGARCDPPPQGEAHAPQEGWLGPSGDPAEGKE